MYHRMRSFYLCMSFRLINLEYNLQTAAKNNRIWLVNVLDTLTSCYIVQLTWYFTFIANNQDFKPLNPK